MIDRHRYDMDSILFISKIPVVYQFILTESLKEHLTGKFSESNRKSCVDIY